MELPRHWICRRLRRCLPTSTRTDAGTWRWVVVIVAVTVTFVGVPPAVASDGADPKRNRMASEYRAWWSGEQLGARLHKSRLHWFGPEQAWGVVATEDIHPGDVVAEVPPAGIFTHLPDGITQADLYDVPEGEPGRKRTLQSLLYRIRNTPRELYPGIIQESEELVTVVRGLSKLSRSHLKQSQQVLLTARLLYHIKLGKRSFFYPYLRMLPDPTPYHPLFFTNKELSALHMDELKNKTLIRRKLLRRDYAALWNGDAGLLQQHGKSDNVSSTVQSSAVTLRAFVNASFLEFLVAFASVTTRTFTLEPVSSWQKNIPHYVYDSAQAKNVSGLVILADAFNHDSRECRHLIHETSVDMLPASYGVHDDSGHFRLISLSAVPQGKQICICYGRKGLGDMFLDYGIVEQLSKDDYSHNEDKKSLGIKVTVDPGKIDPLRSRKLRIFQHLGLDLVVFIPEHSFPILPENADLAFRISLLSENHIRLVENYIRSTNKSVASKAVQEGHHVADQNTVADSLEETFKFVKQYCKTVPFEWVSLRIFLASLSYLIQQNISLDGSARTATCIPEEGECPSTNIGFTKSPAREVRQRIIAEFRKRSNIAVVRMYHRTLSMVTNSSRLHGLQPAEMVAKLGKTMKVLR